MFNTPVSLPKLEQEEESQKQQQQDEEEEEEEEEQEEKSQKKQDARGYIPRGADTSPPPSDGAPRLPPEVSTEVGKAASYCAKWVTRSAPCDTSVAHASQL